MKNIADLTGKGIIQRMKNIQNTSIHQRSARFGRGWAWDITNGMEIIREEYPELVAEMNEAFSVPATTDDLTPVYS